MGPSYSLDYYDRIFGAPSGAYRELLEALSAELQDYASSLVPVLETRDARGLSRLRHAHRPLVENLKLSRLRSLEEALRDALETGLSGPPLATLGSRFQEEALSLASALLSGRIPNGPGPQAPSPGG